MLSAILLYYKVIIFATLSQKYFSENVLQYQVKVYICITKSKSMTNRQQKKLSSIGEVINWYENIVGDIVVEKKYGSSLFQRFYIGKNGGTTTGMFEVYKNYDFNDKKPYNLLWKE